MPQFEGIFPALVTPFQENGAIDGDALDTLVDYLVDSGVQGFYAGGSNAEVHLMNMDERKYVLERVVARAAGRVKIIAQIGCLYTAGSVELAKHAQGLRVDAISSLPPFYYSYTMPELTAYYRDIMDAVPLPMIVYNAPKLTGVAFNSENIADIFASSHAAGVKYTSYDMYQMQRLVEKYPDKTIINGHDEQLLSALAVGVRCAIGSTFVLMPQKYLAMMRHFDNGELDKALEIQSNVNDVIDTLLEVGIFRAVKGVLNLLGLPGGFCRKPFSPLTDAEQQRLKALLPQVR